MPISLNIVCPLIKKRLQYVTAAWLSQHICAGNLIWHRKSINNPWCIHGFTVTRAVTFSQSLHPIKQLHVSSLFLNSSMTWIHNLTVVAISTLLCYGLCLLLFQVIKLALSSVHKQVSSLLSVWLPSNMISEYFYIKVTMFYQEKSFFEDKA